LRRFCGTAVDISTRRLRQSGGSPKVVFDPDNVVLAKIVASLDLNKDKRPFSGIFDPMGHTG